MKGRTIKLVKEDVGEYLMTLEKILGKDSLNVIQKELTINEKIANRTLKSSVYQHIIKKEEQQTTE